METRTDITPANLYLLLYRELVQRQPVRCRACVMPMPFRVDRHEAQAPNWEIVLPADCGGECNDLMQELVFEYQALYELVPSTSDDER
jgi:hypothetical protein